MRKRSKVVALATALMAAAVLITAPWQGLATADPAPPDLNASQPMGINPPTGKFYAYAPSTVEQGNTRHVFYCGNSVSGSVHDHAMISVGTKQSNGSWKYGTPKVALGPESPAPAWANYHICDPEVLQGTFNWSGHTYSWVMLFTAYGNDYPNQLGMAFADSINGPWKIYPTPLLTDNQDFGTDCPQTDYCIGEPAATSVDGKGRMLVYYQGNGGFIRRDVDLSNVTSPNVGPSEQLPSGGLPGWLHNASVVYSPVKGRFYASYDTGLWNKVSNGPPVQTDTSVVSVDAGDLWSGTGSWRGEGTIDGAHSGYAFNHNSGIVHDPYGMLPGTTIEVVHTVANGRTPEGAWGVWTYRLWSNTYTLP